MIGIWIDTSALGDTIAAIPACKKIAAAYPEDHIILFTTRPELFERHQWFSQVFEYNEEAATRCRKLHHLFSPIVGKSYTLSGGEQIEWRYSNMDIRQFHAVSQGFMLQADEMETDLFVERQRELSVIDYVIIHPTFTWASRTWDVQKWQELIDRLNANGIPVVAVGRSGREQGFFNVDKPIMDINIKYGENLLDDPDNNVAELRWMMNHRAKAVITMDSGILHVAGTTDIDIIQLGSSISPKLRAPWRNGSQDYKYKYVGGSCDLFCSSNMKYNVKIHGSIHGVPPQIYCLENKPTFECHPTVDQVFQSTLKLYDENDLVKIDPGRICVTTIFNEAYEDMADITTVNFRKYCQLHGYSFEPILIEEGLEKTPHWQKVRVVKELLQSDKYDWVFFIDLDCLFMNTTIRLERFLSNEHFMIISGHNDQPDTPILNSAGTHSLMTAQFLIKNCEQSIRFLDDVWSAEETRDKIEVFDYEMRQVRYTGDKAEFKNGIKVLSPEKFNRFWYTTSPFMLHHFPETNDNAWRLGDFIVHVPAGHGESRLELLSDLNFFSGGLLVGHEIVDDMILVEPYVDLKNIKIVTKQLDGTLIMTYDIDEVKVRTKIKLFLNDIRNNIRVETYNEKNELISIQIVY